MKRIKGSQRGLTFSLENEKLIGEKFNYFVDLTNNKIIIEKALDGAGTVSRKKCGKRFKPLFDIRSKEVKNLVAEADYLQIEENSDGQTITVSVFKAVKSKIQLFRNKIVSIDDILCRKSGEIILDMASGSEYSFGKPTLFNEEYFSYLESSIPNGFGWGSKKDKKALQNVYKAASLFCGAGLGDYGYKSNPQLEFVWACDFDKSACETYKHNIGNHVVCKDIRSVMPDEIPDCDVYFTSPCCQAYSNANRINKDTETGAQKRRLIDDVVRLVKANLPSIFVVENVPQLLTVEDGLYYSKVVDGLPEYEITSSIISDEAVGGYTIRKRAIVIGALKSKLGRAINLPDSIIHERKTVSDALSKVDSTWPNYKDLTNSRKATKMLMHYVPQGGNWQDIPEDIVIKYRGSAFGPATQSNTYKRLKNDEPGVTVPNWRKCILIHPTEDRILNVSEAAALMGLDKNFKFYGSLDDMQQACGNGITNAIARFVSKHVVEALNEISAKAVIKPFKPVSA